MVTFETTPDPPATPRFTDLAGRSWPLVLTFGLAQRIRDQLDVNFLKPWEGKALTPLADPEKLVQVCWLLCEKQATSQGVSPEEFGEGFGGDQFEDAGRAIEEMLVLFTPPAKRPVAQALQERAAEVQRKATSLAIRKVHGQKVDERIAQELQAADARFDQALSLPIPSGSATNGPASRV